MPKATIAAINGFALGGGCELALACDFRYASSAAKLGQPEVNLGIIPGWGGTQRLARVCGVGIAKELIFTGRIVGAEEALRIGLVNAVFEPGELLERTLETASLIASKGPLAIAAAKEATNRALQGAHAENLERRGRPLRRALLERRREGRHDRLRREARGALHRLAERGPSTPAARDPVPVPAQIRHGRGTDIPLGSALGSTQGEEHTGVPRGKRRGRAGNGHWPEIGPRARSAALWPGPRNRLRSSPPRSDTSPFDN